MLPFNVINSISLLLVKTYFLERQQFFSLSKIGNYHIIGFQTHRPRRVSRRNCDPYSSCHCTWRTVLPAGLPQSSGIPAQTHIGLIKLAVIKNRSKGRREGRQWSSGRKRRSGFRGGEKKARRDRSRRFLWHVALFPKRRG